MRTSGVIRRIDDIGRITIPKSVIDAIGSKYFEPFEIIYDDSGIYLKKYPTERRDMFLKAVDAVCAECNHVEGECNKCPVRKNVKRLNRF